MDWGSCLTQARDANGNVIAEKVVTLDCFAVLFQNFVIAAWTIAGVTALILIIISGIRLIFSGGDAKKLEGARHTLTYAIIGLVVVLMAWAIVQFIAFVTGVTCFVEEVGFTNCK